MLDLKRELEKVLLENDNKKSVSFFAACYEELFDNIFYIAYGFSKKNAEDITQDCFLKILQLDVAKLEPHKDYIGQYMLRLALNYCKDYLSKNKIELNSVHLENIPENDTIFNTSDACNGFDLDKLFANLGIDKLLPESQSTALKKKIEGYTIKDIAKQMGKSIGAIKNLIYRAKINLRNSLF